MADSERLPSEKQRAKSERTRNAVLNAVLDSVHERGWGQLRSADIAKRAGVSLGAMTHQFASKSDMALAAARHIGETYSNAFEQRWSGLDDRASRLDAIIDELWAFNREEKLNALWIELLVAARTDEALKQKVIPEDEAISHGGAAKLAAFLDGTDGENEAFRDLFQLTVYIIRGMAMEQMLRGSEAERERLFRKWGQILAQLTKEAAK